MTQRSATPKQHPVVAAESPTPAGKGMSPTRRTKDLSEGLFFDPQESVAGPAPPASAAKYLTPDYSEAGSGFGVKSMKKVWDGAGSAERLRFGLCAVLSSILLQSMVWTLLFGMKSIVPAGFSALPADLAVLIGVRAGVLEAELRAFGGLSLLTGVRPAVLEWIFTILPQTIIPGACPAFEAEVRAFAALHIHIICVLGNIYRNQ